MALLIRNRCILAAVIISTCSICYFFMYSRVYIRQSSQLKSDRFTLNIKDKEEELNVTTTILHHGSNRYNSINSSKDATTSDTFRVKSNRTTETKPNVNTIKSNKKPLTLIPPTTLEYIKKDFKSSKVILLWTRYYDETQWKLENDFTRVLPMGKTYFNSYCPQYNCYITTNKALYNYSHAIVFHDRNIYYKKDKTMPKYRSPWQRWVFYSIESPRNAYSHKNYPYQTHHAIYNWSMSYLNTSHVDARYGYIAKRMEPTTSWMHSWSIDYHGRKRHLIAWLVSNCLGERLQFVKALSKYIQINIYGRCGSHRCQHKSNIECWKYEIIQYKFYLAFENSVCTDYVSEKFWYPLRFGVIPVVLGGGQYRQIAPPHSYIDVNDFETIPALAKYLHKVANNKTLYNSYMKWRQHWEVIIPRHWCNLCSALHRYNSSSRDTYRTYNDDFGEYGEAKNCKKFLTPRL